MKKHLILMAGHLASGKTTISKRLSKDLNISCFNKDDMKEILAHQIGFSNREENLKLSYATFDMMCYIVKNILMHEGKLILESNFKLHELNKLYDITDQMGIQTYTFYLTGNSKTLYERYLIRDASRDPVHRSTGLLSYEKFCKSMEETPYDHSLHQALVDTTNFDELSYFNLKNTILTFLQRTDNNV